MTADELRELANALEPMACAPRFDGLDVPALTAYLRACADALERGPVAWRNEVRGDGTHGVAASEWRHYNTTSSRDAADRHLLTGGAGIEARAVPLYPLAMPAQAQPLRLPPPLTDAEVHKVSGAQRDALLDHIYEYGTEAEGVMQRVTQLARAIEAEVIRRVKEANK